MHNAVIIPNKNNDRELKVTEALAGKLKSLGFSVFIESKFKLSIDGVTYYDSFPRQAEVIFVVGGDGSVIDASIYAVKYDLPLLGINLGKVGYLSDIEPEDLDTLDRLISGEYCIKEKMLLSVRSQGAGQQLSCRYAVNDIVLSHESYLGIADFVVEDSQGNSLKYRADGIIFSTPQGSTAYSLSAGGPVVAHDVDSIIITPVCPHSFFNRTVILNSREIVKITNTASSALNISIDGRLAHPLEKGEACYVERADKVLKMISFSDNGMFSNLFKKMKIAEGI